MRLRGWSLRESGEGLREAARARLEGRFREGIWGRRRLEARLAFRKKAFSWRFKFLRRRRGSVDARGVRSRASDVTPTPPSERAALMAVLRPQIRGEGRGGELCFRVAAVMGVGKVGADILHDL